MAKIKTNFSLSAEARRELKRIHGRWGSKYEVTTLEQLIFYVGGIVRESVDRTIKDTALRREAEVKIEMLKHSNG